MNILIDTLIIIMKCLWDFTFCFYYFYFVMGVWEQIWRNNLSSFLLKMSGGFGILLSANLLRELVIKYWAN